MIINWLETQVHINLAGQYHWPRGMKTNPTWSRWVFDHQLRLCTRGRGWINLHQGRTPLKRGSCQWLRAGWDYEIEGDPSRPLAFLTIRFDLLNSSGQSRLNSAGLPPEDLTHKIDATYLETEMLRIVGDVLPHRNRNPLTRFGSSFSATGRLRATARLTALLMEVDEATFDKKQPPIAADAHPRELKLQEIARRLREQPGRAPSVDELAREARYTRAHFCRAFKHVNGLAPQHFIITWRIRHAQQMLVETSMPVKAIAARLGYRDSEFFSRQFHQHTGRSPLAFRKKHQLPL